LQDRLNNSRRRIMEEERFVTPTFIKNDQSEAGLRPKIFDEYFGQEKIKQNLKVFIEAAKLRHEPIDHVLLAGPPGLGKTTLAGIIASEMGANIRITSGPAIEKAGDLAAILTNIDVNDIILLMKYIDLTEQLKKFYILRWRILHLT